MFIKFREKRGTEVCVRSEQIYALTKIRKKDVLENYVGNDCVCCVHLLDFVTIRDYQKSSVLDITEQTYDELMRKLYQF